MSKPSKRKKASKMQNETESHAGDEGRIPYVDEPDQSIADELAETLGGTSDSANVVDLADDEPKVTYVPVEKMLAVVEEVGLKPLEMAAWIRIDGPNAGRVYLPRRKSIGRVHIAAMETPEGLGVKLGEKSFGAVKETLDMKQPEERILKTFRAVLLHMASLPAPTPAEKPKRGGRVKQYTKEPPAA